MLTTFEQSKELKELGYNIPTNILYNINGTLSYEDILCENSELVIACCAGHVIKLAMLIRKHIQVNYLIPTTGFILLLTIKNTLYANANNINIC